MKKIIEDVDDGMESLLGETVTFFCANYFYTGKLVGVNTSCVKLESPKIIYETGAWDDPNWADAQSLPGDIYIQIPLIEAFGVQK